MFFSYWVIAVVPYLLYAFVTNHTEAECQRIYKVSKVHISRRLFLKPRHKIPVALAMWNQVGSECPSFLTVLPFPHIDFGPYMPAVLLIRTYAFFNRNNYLLAALVCALAGVVGYQLFVDTSEMMRMFLGNDMVIISL